MKRIGLIAMSFLFAMGLVAVDKAADCPKTVKVLTEKVMGESFVEHVTFKGTLSTEKAELASKVDGKVTKLAVGVGDLVSADFQMLEIDGALANEMAASQKELDIWKKRMKTRQGWKERNSRAEAQAEEQIKRIEEKLAKLNQKALSELICVAPIAGKVVSLNVAVDQSIKTNEMLLVIENSKRKIVALPMDESTAKLFNENGYKLDVKGAKIEAIKLGYQSGQMLLAVEDENLAIQSDTPCSLTIVKKTHNNAVVIAESLVQTVADKNAVFVVEGEFARLRNVKIAVRELSKVLVSDGLNQEDEIIVAEVTDSKKMQLSPVGSCLKDNGQVVVLVKDEKKNQFVKQPKGTKAKVHEAQAEQVKSVPTVKPKAEKKQVVKKEKVEKVKTVSDKKAIGLALGLRAGLLSSNYSYDVASGSHYTVESGSKQSIAFAGVIEYAISKDFSVGADVASLAKDSIFSMTINNKTTDLENKKQYLELTLYGKYHLPLKLDKDGKARLFALLGFSYGQKSSGTWQYLYNETEIVTADDTDEHWARIDSGFVGGLGGDFAFSSSFSLLADLRLGMGNRNLAGNSLLDTLKSKGLQFSLSGLFRF